MKIHRVIQGPRRLSSPYGSSPSDGASESSAGDSSPGHQTEKDRIEDGAGGIHGPVSEVGYITSAHVSWGENSTTWPIHGGWEIWSS